MISVEEFYAVCDRCLLTHEDLVVFAYASTNGITEEESTRQLESLNLGNAPRALCYISKALDECGSCRKIYRGYLNRNYEYTDAKNWEAAFQKKQYIWVRA